MKITSSLLPLILLVASTTASAMYKCEADGKVSYSDTPCAGAKVIEPAPMPPTTNASSSNGLTEQKRELRRLEAERHKREAKDEKESVRAARQAAAHRKKCGTLEQRKHWAEEDAAAAAGKSANKAKRKARRASEQYVAECAS